jgi:hypothetical protein
MLADPRGAGLHRLEVPERVTDDYRDLGAARLIKNLSGSSLFSVGCRDPEFGSVVEAARTGFRICAQQH